MPQDIPVNDLINDERVRKVEHEGKSYFSLIDAFSVLLNINRQQAQNYYHVFKKRLVDNHLNLPLIQQFKAQSFDRKFYLTEFTTLEGIEFFYSESQTNIKRRRVRSEERKSDEIINFHPKVEGFLQENGWQTQHHVRLLSGSVIDIVAYLGDIKYVVECKPE